MAEGIKRINPDTGKPFKRGDVREDGYSFVRYNNRVNKKGLKGEIWLSPSAFDKELENSSIRSKRNQTRKEDLLPKRLNPYTNKPFVFGEVENGKVFLQYMSRNDISSDFRDESWGDVRTFLRKKIQTLIANYALEAAREEIPFNIDVETLVDIFPQNLKCPFLDKNIGWLKDGKERERAALITIKKAKGYTKGNVIWCSKSACELSKYTTTQLETYITTSRLLGK